jgi:hypothetical protein
MDAADRGQTSIGNAMPSKTRPQKSERKKSKAGPLRAYATSTILVTTLNIKPDQYGRSMCRLGHGSGF